MAQRVSTVISARTGDLSYAGRYRCHTYSNTPVLGDVHNCADLKHLAVNDWFSTGDDV
jgi:hypothetical protein